MQALGRDGFARLAASCERSTQAIVDAVGGIQGLRIVGTPVGPLLAVSGRPRRAPEDRVDPHHWADEVRTLGFQLQLQPGMTQPDGAGRPPRRCRPRRTSRSPRSRSPCSTSCSALFAPAADAARGTPPAVAELPPLELATLDSDTAAAILGQLGVGDGLPGAARRALLALIQATPAPLAERLLIELLARLVEP